MPLFLVSVYNLLKAQTWLLTLIFCLACTVVIFFVKVKFATSYLPDISGSERSTTYGIQLVADGRPLYYNPEVPPFWVTQYAPLYYRLVGTIYRIIGWDPTQVFRIQLLSRMVSFALVMVSMLVVFLTGLRQLKLRLVQNLILCCLVFGVLQHWHLTNSRVDSLLFLCTTTLIYCALEGLKKPAIWNGYWISAALIAVVAFFVKQSGMIHIAVILAFLFITAQWLILIRTIGIMAALFLVLTLLCDEGHMDIFFQNLFISVTLPLSPGWFYGYTFRYLIPAASLLIAVAWLISLKWLFTSLDSRQQFLALAAMLFFGFATATAFKHGAAVGYYHEFAYTGLLIIFWYFCDQIQLMPTGSLGRYLFPAMVSMTMLYFASQQLDNHLNTDYGYYARQYRDETLVKSFVEPQLGKQDYVVALMGDNYRGWLLQQMLFRHQLAYTDDIIRFLYIGKKHDFSQFGNLVKQGSIKFIIAPKKQPLYYFAFEYTFDPKDYVLQKEISGYQIFKHI
ncbi:hypothetical protein [Spirosoma panaciterrae]|uniref:hypothetical protein n=1 Tax=Spirosoma panaciterrae TaxID=496058 RepID=UPI00036F45CA|nr:hypothetical protein [Spirosoma panaciterrae]